MARSDDLTRQPRSPFLLGALTVLGVVALLLVLWQLDRPEPAPEEPEPRPRLASAPPPRPAPEPPPPAPEPPPEPEPAPPEPEPAVPAEPERAETYIDENGIERSIYDRPAPVRPDFDPNAAFPEEGGGQMRVLETPEDERDRDPRENVPTVEQALQLTNRTIARLESQLEQLEARGDDVRADRVRVRLERLRREREEREGMLERGEPLPIPGGAEPPPPPPEGGPAAIPE